MSDDPLANAEAYYAAFNSLIDKRGALEEYLTRAGDAAFAE